MGFLLCQVVLKTDVEFHGTREEQGIPLFGSVSYWINATSLGADVKDISLTFVEGQML